MSPLIQVCPEAGNSAAAVPRLQKVQQLLQVRRHACKHLCCADLWAVLGHMSMRAGVDDMVHVNVQVVHMLWSAIFT